MRKLVTSLFVLLVGFGVAFAQAPNVSTADGYNDAFIDITVTGTAPGQVSFELPTTLFTLTAANIVPGTALRLNIEIRNLSDRTITVRNDNTRGAVQPSVISQYITSGTITIAAGSTGWFTYNIDLPAAGPAYDAIVTAANAAPYNGVVTVQARLLGEGVLPTSNPVAGAGF